MNRSIAAALGATLYALFVVMLSGSPAYAQSEATAPLTTTAVLVTPTVVTVTEELAEPMISVQATQAYTVAQAHTDPCMSPCTIIFEASAPANWKINNNGAVTTVEGRQRFGYQFQGPLGMYSFKYEATFPNGQKAENLPFMLQMIPNPQFTLPEYTCLLETSCRVQLKFDAPLAVGPYTVNTLGATYLQSKFVDPQHLDVLFNSGDVATELNVTVVFAQPPYTQVYVSTKVRVIKVEIVISMPIIRTGPALTGQ